MRSEAGGLLVGVTATENKTAADWILVAPGSEAPVQILGLLRDLAPMSWRVARLTFHVPTAAFNFETLEAAESHVATAGSVDLNMAWRVEWVVMGSPGKLTGNLVPGLRQVYLQLDNADRDTWSLLHQTFHAHYPSDVRIPLPEGEAAEFHNLRAEIVATLEACRSDRETWKGEAAKALEEAKAALTTLEKTYDEKLALKSAVKYWTAHSRLWAQRAAARKRWAIIIGVVTVLAMGLAGLGLIARYSASQPPYWLLFAVLLVFGLLVWTLRLIVRAMLSDLHLAEEARLRAVMTTTYLALVREGLAEKDDRRLVLENIYRPTAAGLVGDEPLPSTITELIRSFGRR